MKTCFCAGKGRQDTWISLKDELVGDMIHSFPPLLIQAHWEPNTGYSYSYPNWARVQKEAGWMDNGLRTPLQTQPPQPEFSPHHLSHHQPCTSSHLFWGNSSPFHFSFPLETISESNLLLIITNTDTTFLLLVPSPALPYSTPSWSLYSPSESVYHT